MFCIATLVVNAESYPAQCRVTTTLNVRRGPGTDYSKLGILNKNDCVVVNAVIQNGSTKWGSIIPEPALGTLTPIVSPILKR